MLLVKIVVAVFLVFTALPSGECSDLGQVIEKLWARFERLWDANPLQFLKGPLKFLEKIPGLNLVRTVIRFAISTIVKIPFKAMLKAFDFVCDTLTNEGLIGKGGLIKPEDLSISMINLEGKETFALPLLKNIVESDLYLKNRTLTIFIPGWSQESSKGDDYDTTTKELITAYNSRNDCNFGVMNLGDTLDNLYTWSAYNAREVGGILGLYLSKLTDIPAEQIHLIGAGLGAQIAGYAGKKFIGKTTKKMARITALDPSRPCFGNTGLDKTAAKLVDIIHSSKLFGTFETKGHVDFYANRISTTLPSKGCKSFLCLHQQAVLYFAESVMEGQEGNFCGVQCASRNRFELGECKDNEKILMGFLCPTNAKGSHYLNTNHQSPYGQCKDSPTTTEETIDSTSGSEEISSTTEKEITEETTPNAE